MVNISLVKNKIFVKNKSFVKNLNFYRNICQIKILAKKDFDQKQRIGRQTKF